MGLTIGDRIMIRVSNDIPVQFRGKLGNIIRLNSVWNSVFKVKFDDLILYGGVSSYEWDCSKSILINSNMINKRIKGR